jgi:hypothetical protein
MHYLSSIKAEIQLDDIVELRAYDQWASISNLAIWMYLLKQHAATRIFRSSEVISFTLEQYTILLFISTGSYRKHILDKLVCKQSFTVVTFGGII